jgi:hypothetical protein
MYVINIIDGPYGDFARATLYTMRQTWKNVYVFEGNRDWSNATRSFFVLLGTDAALNTDALNNFDAGDGDAMWARLLATDDDIRTLLNSGPLVTLTDQYAPVDQMLASAFLEQVPQKK